MRLQYIGMFDEVEVPEFVDPATGYSKLVKRGESVEIPDALAERLLDQPANWRRSAGGPVPAYNPDAGAEPPTAAEPESTGTTPEG